MSKVEKKKREKVYYLSTVSHHLVVSQNRIFLTLITIKIVSPLENDLRERISILLFLSRVSRRAENWNLANSVNFP